ncbi:MAG: sulfite exporter TauE/SafE family protein [Sideroxydans sp.]|nr:sulfite exporter TauE/SafE family protein [Sideroxydans sp.]NOT98006.1 sulfite exporter TauE/SafE family protein [Sideroxydans sp.]
MFEFSLFAVFVVGLLGGIHCLGMCGSIVGIFTTQVPREKARWPFHLAYSSGRIGSYAVAGALVGAVGQAGFLMRDAVPIQHLLFALSSLMLIALGLYLAGIWGAVRTLEKVGAGLWKRLQPFTTRLLPVNTLPRALGLGVLWGWLPCGLVYSVLISALASGSAAQGAFIMLAFGLGTLPNLLAIGLFWEGIKAWAQSPRVRLLAGSIIALFGVYGLVKVSYTFYMHGWSGACHVAA